MPSQNSAAPASLQAELRRYSQLQRRAEILFSEVEIRVLSAWAKSRRTPPPTTLGEAILLVARIGGYINRNNDPPPGHELMWYGYQNLTLMCMGYELRET